MVASVEEDTTDNLPDRNCSKEFYAKYEPRHVLGRGVSSTVRNCLEKSSEREYAVKIIDLTQNNDNSELTEEMRRETKREIQILRKCSQHPNIIELHDAFESEAFIFLVFEICREGELFDYLTKVVTLSEKRTRFLLRQLLSAVEFLHSLQIVHRDLKPENILLDDELNVKLSDFGFAIDVTHDEELTDLFGTPGFLAPEALKASMYEDAPGYGRPVDLWACGVIMYTVLCGSPPFWHRKQMIMIRMIMEGRYSFPSPEWDDISENAKDLISKLLVVDPKKRLTATEALAHPFFKLKEEVNKSGFIAKRKFKASVFVYIAVKRICLMRSHANDANLTRIQLNPYAMKLVRKEIDKGAFRIYGHWVKKGENQNRAALFENNVKRDIKMNATSPVNPHGEMTIIDASANVESLSQHFDKFCPQVVVGDRVGRHQSLTSPIVGHSAAATCPPPAMLLVPSQALRKLSRRDAARHGAEIRISATAGSIDQERNASLSTRKSSRWAGLLQVHDIHRSQQQ